MGVQFTCSHTRMPYIVLVHWCCARTSEVMFFICITLDVWSFLQQKSNRKLADGLYTEHRGNKSRIPEIRWERLDQD